MCVNEKENLRNYHFVYNNLDWIISKEEIPNISYLLNNYLKLYGLRRESEQVTCQQ